MDIFAAIAAYGPFPVIIILMAGIPAIINFISWGKKLWMKRQAFKQASFKEGEQSANRQHEKEERLANDEKRISDLEEIVKGLNTVINQQSEMLKQLRESDMLAIKTWIKEQHSYWMSKGYIENQAFDLLCQRHEIYKKEDGNSWADELVTEMKQLPKR